MSQIASPTPSPSPSQPSALRPSLLRRVVSGFIAPDVFDFWASHIDPAWSWNRPLARIVERRLEAQDAVTLVLKPNRHCPRVQPGQHINLTAEVQGRRTTRSYSVSNAPGRDGRLAVTVKRVEGGKLSTHLSQRSQVGDVVEIGHVFGDMTLAPDATVPAAPARLFLAAGSGITPLMSLTRALARQGMPGTLDLVYSVRTRPELCFLHELRTLQLQHPHFKLHVVLTGTGPVLEQETAGRLTADRLLSLVPDLSQREVYACGSHEFISAMREFTAPHTARFMAEAFTPAPVAALGDDANRTVTVRLAQSGRELQIPVGTSLLEGLESHGLEPHAGCRMGVCHTCVCTRREGSTQHMLTGETDSQPDLDVRICINRATTDLTLDL